MIVALLVGVGLVALMASRIDWSFINEDRPEPIRIKIDEDKPRRD
ncbi:hypothetical protein NFC81_05440 [Salinispirillum sp. LH 10-3-1]|uniref:Uncharacterized protein n=1 Tax=Salinispirillum sp. LH 10-3-1 TaxID=2952525 RepID=A0AB38YIP7_9GAMM